MERLQMEAFVIPIMNVGSIPTRSSDNVSPVFLKKRELLTMRKYEKVGNYEQEVINVLIDGFYYSEKEAVSIVNGYNSIMTRIGFFDNPKDWAMKLDEAMRYHITPDMWHNVL